MAFHSFKSWHEGHVFIQKIFTYSTGIFSVLHGVPHATSARLMSCENGQ